MKHYREGAPWRGLPRWECELCPFDSLTEADLPPHVAAKHFPPPPKPPRPLVVQVDRYGNPVNPPPPAEPEEVLNNAED